MAELKTKPTNVSVEAFLNAVPDAQKREDAFTLLKVMKKITGKRPKMWGPSMVGFGQYHYVYDSGHEGDCFLTGFAPRKNALTLYVMCGRGKQAGAQLKKLGKVKVSKSCLYIKKLSDVDLAVLGEMIEASLADLAERSKSAAKAMAKKSKKR